MNGFAHFSRTATELESELVKLGIALEIDWDDPARVRQLAREALQGGARHTQALLESPDPDQALKGELFALSVLMLRTMEDSAEVGIHTHGGPVWKAFGRALLEESGAHLTRPGVPVR